MASLKKHRRQWLISSEKALPSLSSLPGFRVAELEPGLYLHHDCDLRVSTHEWAGGGKTTLLGRLLGEPESPDRLHYNTGRFVAITAGKLSLDATGSMGVFFFPKAESVICGSSPALISEVTGLSFTGRTFGKGEAMNWTPVPLAPLPGARTMFVDQVLDLRDGSVSTIRRELSGGATVEAAAKRLGEQLVQTGKDLAGAGQPILQALTAGLDSRTVFAAFQKAGVPFEAFTLLLSDSSSRIDARTAKQLCDLFGIRHDSVERGGKRQDALETYISHSGGRDGDRGRDYALGDYYRLIPDEALVLHGGVFEIGQRYYEKKFAGIDFGSREKAISGLAAAFDGQLNSEEIGALTEWYDHRAEYPFTDFVDAFYIDQRRGGWGAANRQAEDVFGFEWVLCANSWATIDTILSVGPDERRHCLIQKKLIGELLADVKDRVPPVNPPMTFFERMQGRFSARGRKKAMQRIRRVVGRFSGG